MRKYFKKRQNMFIKLIRDQASLPWRAWMR